MVLLIFAKQNNHFSNSLLKTRFCHTKKLFKIVNFFIVTLPNLNYNNNENRQINRQINNLGLSILKLINSKPGIKVHVIYNELFLEIKDLNFDIIRYEL